MSDKADVLTQLEALDVHLRTQGTTVALLLDQVGTKMMGYAPFEPAEVADPVNVDVPYVEQSDDSLHCTMGNWQGTPTAYHYQWARDGQEIGEDSAVYGISESDVGRSFHCTVTATNAAGSTKAPPSNDVIAG